MKDTEVMMDASETKNALKFREQLYRLVIRCFSLSSNHENHILLTV